MADRLLALRRARGGAAAARSAWALVLFVACVALASVGVSQEEPTTPEGWLQRAREAVVEAREVRGAHTPDRPAWDRALTLAQRAVEEADPGSDAELEALRFLASTYNEVSWWSRAWRTWEQVRERAELTTEEADARRRAGLRLAYARYEAGAVEAALDSLRALLEERPNDVEALRVTGRILLELGRHEEAAPLFERVLELVPGDEQAADLLALARERARFGRQASDAYQQGLDHYEQGSLEEALAAFEEAVAAAPSFQQAERWRARLLLETGRSERAAQAWQRIAEAHPEDDSADYFAERARLQSRVGRTAALAADEARAAMEADDPERAVAAWQRAVEAAPDWLEARAGLARAAQVAGNTEAAREAWQAVLDRTSEGDALHGAAERGLQVADVLLALGAEAGPHYAEGVELFEQGELAAAEEAFERAAEAAPESPQTWGWLGRIAFSREAYGMAAERYRRAAELAPEDDYAYFAQQAERLADAPAEDEGQASGQAEDEATPPAPPQQAEDGAEEETQP